MKELIKIVVFVIFFSVSSYCIGYFTAKNEIITKILAEKKDCYSLADLAVILHK